MRDGTGHLPPRFLSGGRRMARGRGKRAVRLAALALVLLASWSPGQTQAAASPPIMSYPATGASGVSGLTTGPDGNLWFTTDWNYKIGKMTPSGVVSLYSAAGNLVGITVGPDGNLWFADRGANQIGKVTTGGSVTEYTVPTASSAPLSIVTGPDGNLWFTESGAAKIGMVTTSGSFTQFTIPSGYHACSITSGPDGNLWFGDTNGQFGNIGRITTGGSVTEQALPGQYNDPWGITSGPDGNLWFLRSGNTIGKMTTSFTYTAYTLPHPYSITDGGAGLVPTITTGPDGNLWFTESGRNAIGRITTSGTITEYSIPTAGNIPISIVTGPDGNLWFTEYGAVNNIGKLNLHYSATPLSLAVTGAALSIASPSSALSASPIVLNGSSQSVTSTLPLTVTDARGTGAGWSLSIDAADPKTSGSKTIPFSGMTLGPQPAGIVDSSGTSPLNLTTGPPGNLSGSDSSPGTTTSNPSTLLTAPALQGMGMYTQNEGITLTVPATASTGTYTTTLIVVVQ
jgi:virginiamycin B lyase